MRTVGIFVWSNRQGSALRNSIATALKDYAAGRAWTQPEIIIAEDGRKLFEEGGTLGSILSGIGAGDKVILKSFSETATATTPFRGMAGRWSAPRGGCG